MVATAGDAGGAEVVVIGGIKVRGVPHPAKPIARRGIRSRAFAFIALTLARAAGISPIDYFARHIDGINVYHDWTGEALCLKAAGVGLGGAGGKGAQYYLKTFIIPQ
jgi:hypothetical protein